MGGLFVPPTLLLLLLLWRALAGMNERFKPLAKGFNVKVVSIVVLGKVRSLEQGRAAPFCATTKGRR
jgi:hypothetical protein